MAKVILMFILSLSFLFVEPTHARTTPEDILNEQKAVYNQGVHSYSPQSKQKLEDYSKKIASLNLEITKNYTANLMRQGEILEEYVARNSLGVNSKTDGINRNLGEPVENAKYWLTYAHEAVAFQEGKVYVFNLTSEKNINTDITTSISQLQNDTSILRGKVLKSQQLILKLISN